jgi:hypothetical protein
MDENKAQALRGIRDIHTRMKKDLEKLEEAYEAFSKGKDRFALNEVGSGVGLIEDGIEELERALDYAEDPDNQS